LLFFNSAVDHDPMRNPSSPAWAPASVPAHAARVALLLASVGLAACTSETSSSLSIASSAPATEPSPSDPSAPAASDPSAPAPTPTPAPAPAAASEPAGTPTVPEVITKRVFVTSAAFSGDLKTEGAGADGFDGADKLCTQAAAAAGLTSTFRAFLSGKHAGADVAAIDRIPQAGAWVQLDGELVFVDPGEMTGSPRSPITITETGQPLAGGSVWTASLSGRRSGDACEDATGESWSSTTTASPAVTGFPTTTIQWTFATPAACAATAHLYCFEQ
jgi:hypothetical protein